MSSQRNARFHVATLGRTVGLKGDMKLHVKSDFPEQFVPGARFESGTGETLELEQVNLERMIVRVKGFESPEAAKRLTNAKLYASEAATRESCGLEPGEFFWFDVIGCEVFESGALLGSVREIERIGAVDYLSVATAEAWRAKGLPKTFLLPYQDPFILDTDVQSRRIDVRGGLDILEAS